MYRGQRDRLMKEIADLQKKLADQNSKATIERGDARRVANSVSRTMSDSIRRQVFVAIWSEYRAASLLEKQGDIQRHEENAAKHSVADGDRVFAPSSRDGIATATLDLADVA